ncbi:MAG: response regulator [Gammaproteobacteria bacterium]|nr:response regulator [Gammaproteobacteria bacterium]
MAEKTVLIVDDSRVSRMLIKSVVIDRHPEWSIIESGSGDEALTHCGESIDLMIIDFNMPGMNGMVLAEKMKALYPSAYISMLTANVQEIIQKRAEVLGIGFAKKPITEDKIADIMSQVE